MDAEIEYSRARVDITKIDILLMMTLQPIPGSHIYVPTVILSLIKLTANPPLFSQSSDLKARLREQSNTIDEISRYREAQFRQLRRLESDLDPDKERSGDTNSGLSILTVDSAVSAQSDRESTFSTYD